MTNAQEIEKAVEIACDNFQGYYLDWLNNFLTVEYYANYYGITENTARQRINIGRKIHEQRTSKLNPKR